MSEQVIEKELQEMELPSQSKTKANAAAKPGDPAPKAGSNASNIGLFEYDVPPNFTALSTKGLNE